MNALLRDLGPQVLGAIVRRYRDLAACEDAVQEALLSAASTWPRSGRPENPRAWLIAVANRRMADRVRDETARRLREEIVVSLVPPEEQLALAADETMAQERDDSLELMFMCCQPALSRASAIALTLRSVGGLSTAEIARAFFVPEVTMGQRLSRARQTLRDSGVVEVDRSTSLRSVMRVLSLIFNEGYVASGGDTLQRVDLAEEAIRLARLLMKSAPTEPEVMGLLALMLLTHARRDARVGRLGALVPLDAQDRATWHRADIEEGSALVSRAFSIGAVGPYQLQAAIAALHDEATSTETTDWAQIRTLYEVLLRIEDSPMARLSHAIAVAMVEGPAEGLKRLESLGDSHRVEAARGHLLERLGRNEEARGSFLRAAGGTGSTAERDYLRLKAAGLRPG